MRQREIGFVDAPIYRSAAVAAAVAAAAVAAEVRGGDGSSGGGREARRGGGGGSECSDALKKTRQMASVVKKCASRLVLI